MVFVHLNIQFLSTPSARRATIGVVLEAAGLEISIHALREEGDPAGPLKTWTPN